MREAVERVIAELEETISAVEFRRNQADFSMLDMYNGQIWGLNYALREIKEVLKTADNNPRNTPELERDDKRQQAE
jgi:hypothetical protein